VATFHCQKPTIRPKKRRSGPEQGRIREAGRGSTSAPGALPCPCGRRWSLFGGIPKIGSHPRQHCPPRGLGNPHARHKKLDGCACPRQASGAYVAQQGRESCPKNVDVVGGPLAT
jgi:hypothetical protein